MHLKRSRKSKRHFRRRSIRHRRRTHNRKGGGKAELEAELAQLEANWKKVCNSGAPFNSFVYNDYNERKTRLCQQITDASRKEEVGIPAAVAAEARAAAAHEALLAASARAEAERPAREEAARQRQAQEDARMEAWRQQHMAFRNFNAQGGPQ